VFSADNEAAHPVNQTAVEMMKELSKKIENPGNPVIR